MSRTLHPCLLPLITHNPCIVYYVMNQGIKKYVRPILEYVHFDQVRIGKTKHTLVRLLPSIHFQCVCSKLLNLCIPLLTRNIIYSQRNSLLQIMSNQTTHASSDGNIEKPAAVRSEMNKQVGDWWDRLHAKRF